MKRLQRVKNESGAVSKGLLIVLMVVIIGAIAVITLSPRSPVSEPTPVAARGKIPSMPVPDQPPQPETTQATAAEEAAQHGETESPDATVQSGQTPVPPGTDVLPDTPRTETIQTAESAQTADKPDPEPSTLSDGESPASMPAVAQDDTRPDPVPDTTAALEDGKAETTNPDDTTEISTANAVAVNAPDKMPASDQPVPSTADGTDDANGTSEAPEAEGLMEDAAQPEADVAEKAVFVIQVGAFRTKAFAENMTSNLKELGYPAFIHESMGREQRPLYLVRFGNFGSREGAVRSAKAFKEKEKMQALVLGPESQ